MPKLLLATSNRGKVLEYRSLLKSAPYRIVSLGEAGISGAVEETGTSLEENARLKAVWAAERSGLLTLADDSGLEVDALGGEPGAMSARYAGPAATDSDRVNYLLARLEGVPRKKRTARFRCVIALAAPRGEVELFLGECEGLIIFGPRGAHGFGYDPVFYFPELGKTMAELSPETKNQVSHRGQAARKALPALRRLSRLSEE